MLRDFIDSVISFAKAHPEYLIPIVFAVAFAECLAFVSIIAPATVLFAAFGAIAGAIPPVLFALTESPGTARAPLGIYVLGP